MTAAKAPSRKRRKRGSDREYARDFVRRYQAKEVDGDFLAIMLGIFADYGTWEPPESRFAPARDQLMRGEIDRMHASGMPVTAARKVVEKRWKAMGWKASKQTVLNAYYPRKKKTLG